MFRDSRRARERENEREREGMFPMFLGAKNDRTIKEFSSFLERVRRYYSVL